MLYESRIKLVLGLMFLFNNNYNCWWSGWFRKKSEVETFHQIDSKTMKIDIYASPNMNKGQALNFEIVFLYDEVLWNTIEKMTASEYFTHHQKIKNRNINLIRSATIDIVPGKIYATEELTFPTKNLKGVVCFANYEDEGNHSIILSPDNKKYKFILLDHGFMPIYDPKKNYLKNIDDGNIIYEMQKIRRREDKKNTTVLTVKKNINTGVSSEIQISYEEDISPVIVKNSSSHSVKPNKKPIPIANNNPKNYEIIEDKTNKGIDSEDYEIIENKTKRKTRESSVSTSSVVFSGEDYSFNIKSATPDIIKLTSGDGSNIYYYRDDKNLHDNSQNSVENTKKTHNNHSDKKDLNKNKKEKKNKSDTDKNPNKNSNRLNENNNKSNKNRRLNNSTEMQNISNQESFKKGSNFPSYNGNYSSIDSGIRTANDVSNTIMSSRGTNFEKDKASMLYPEEIKKESSTESLDNNQSLSEDKKDLSKEKPSDETGNSDNNNSSNSNSHSDSSNNINGNIQKGSSSFLSSGTISAAGSVAGTLYKSPISNMLKNPKKTLLESLIKTVEKAAINKIEKVMKVKDDTHDLV